MNLLFLFPYPSHIAPSQRFRFEQYLQYLEQAGHVILPQAFWSEASWAILYEKGRFLQKTLGFTFGLIRRFAVLFRLKNIDYVFIHRECLPIGPPIIEWLISKVFEKKIIYDFDDAIWLPNTSDENKVVSILKWHSKVEFICKWSYKISCGNSYLADYARQFNKSVFVNPTTIDTNFLHNPSVYAKNKDASVVTIGWTGTHSTLQFLEPLMSAIQQLGHKFQIRFVVIANKKPSFENSTMKFIKWNSETEIPDLLSFDIGVMPLTDNKWTRGKCGFKALQYMALEIPTVASAVGVNTSIIDQGVDGFLCSSEDEWTRILSLLIQDAQLRTRIGKRGREKIVKNYSIDSNTRNFLSLFS